MARMAGVAVLALLLLPVPSTAAEFAISFDEIPPANSEENTLSEEYARLGIHFVTTDDGAIWSGLSNGDPGRWGLEGTNGPAFVGFDGDSDIMILLFEDPVRGVQVDVARAAGSRAGDGFTIKGLRRGVVVEYHPTKLPPVNQWVTMEIEGRVDTVVLFGWGHTQIHPFGIDNLRWRGRPRVRTVEIDIRPGSDENPIQPQSGGVVPIALFGTEDFDVADVDPESLVFGRDAAPLAHRKGPHFEDVDGDGLLDLVSHHRTRDTGVAPGDEDACLEGVTYDGLAFEGCDLVTVVPRR